MKQRLGTGSRAGWIVRLLILGTGCLLALLWQQNMLMERLLEQGKECLVRTGFYTSDSVEYLQHKKDGKLPGWVRNAFPTLAWLEEQPETAETGRDSGIEAFALLYPGKKSNHSLWSGAAGEMAAGERLFRRDDAENEEEVLAASASGADAELYSQMEAAALAENEAFREDHREESGEKMTDENLTDSKARVSENIRKIRQLQNTHSLQYLLKNFYIVDSSTSVDKGVFDVETLLNMSLALKKKNDPQILIFHTHGASERFIDSDPSDQAESIVGVGSVLAEILEKKYGYHVIHDKTEYDRVNGRIDRNKAYNKAYKGVKATLEKYPDIQVVIDLHRDGVGRKVHRLTTIQGKKTAQVMFFNGLSRNRKGNIKYLKNENLQSNLAFSLQLKMKSMELYSDFSKPVYLKGYRYNLHLRKRSLLIELGNENNTLQEAKNAMEPLARVLDEVLNP